MQLRDHAGVVLPERSAPVGQDPQDGELLVIDDRSQAGHPGADQCDGVRIGGIGGIGLAALPGGEHADPSRQLRRHVHHLLALGQQPGRDVTSDASAPLDCPVPLGPALYVREHRGEACLVGGVTAAAEHRLVRRHHLDRDRALVRIHADDHAGHVCLPAGARWDVEQGGQRYFELSKPPLSLSLLNGARPAQAMKEPHDESWAAAVRATGRAPRPSLAQAPILRS